MGPVHPPTLVIGAAEGTALVDDEQFGPILPLVAYDDLDAVVDRVNDGPFGLGATVWGSDAARARAVAERLDVGMAWVNRTPMPDPAVPFGGMRESGIGREGGAAGLDAFCELKTIGTAR
ncbi:aldehyde dehydrogenase family protein [Leucobacter allii]|nr:aldehyde dehydrogenase family protein [Leucobacter allii]UOR03444.1 aldehyde dehydrogenase family protein [Leucobacter allii]